MLKSAHALPIGLVFPLVKVELALGYACIPRNPLFLNEVRLRIPIEPI